MPRYAVLLRGINVGTAKRVAMADLRALLAELGYTAVRTVLNSGNAIVTGPEADPAEQADRIAAALAATTGVVARCIVLTADEVAAIVAGNPFAETVAAAEKGGSRMMAHVLSSTPGPARALVEIVALDPDHAAAGQRVIYQWCPDGLLAAPPLGTSAEKQLGVAVTGRNWNTMVRLDTLMHGADG